MTLEEELQITMEEFSLSITQILGENLLSVILYGSVVLGDFVPGKGDLDFLVITRDSLKDGDCEKLFGLHDRMRAGEMGRLAIQLEGVYCPLCLVQSPGTAVSRGCYIGTGRRGWKEIDRFCTSPVDYAIIHKFGKVYYGEDIKAKIHDPGMQEIKEFFLEEIGKDIATVDEINSVGYCISLFQKFPRAVCTLLTGQYLSKREAAKWFISEYPNNQWRELVEHAAQYRFPLSEQDLNSIRPGICAGVKDFLVCMSEIIVSNVIKHT